MHLWSLDGVHNVFSTHLVVDANLARADIRRIKQAVRAAVQDPDLEHVTIEIEYEGEASHEGLPDQAVR